MSVAGRKAVERRIELVSEMTPAIWVHLVFVVAAVVLGGVVLFRRKGDARHRVLGRAWVGAMAVAAVSSFWIVEINAGGFSPIHALSAWTLFALVAGVVAIRSRGRVPNAIHWHKRFLQSLYASGLAIAGGFTLLPDRLLGRLTFGEVMPAANYVLVGLLASFGAWLLVRAFARPDPSARKP